MARTRIFNPRTGQESYAEDNTTTVAKTATPTAAKKQDRLTSTTVVAKTPAEPRIRPKSAGADHFEPWQTTVTPAVSPPAPVKKPKMPAAADQSTWKTTVTKTPAASPVMRPTVQTDRRAAQRRDLLGDFYLNATSGMNLTGSPKRKR